MIWPIGVTVAGQSAAAGAGMIWPIGVTVAGQGAAEQGRA